MEINAEVRQKKPRDKSRKIIFRVDASKEVGMGHLVRCLALASELQEQHFCEITFVTTGNNGISGMIKKRGFGVKVLLQNISKGDELNQLIEFARECSAEAVILDLKNKIDAEYILELKKLNVPLISIDNESEAAFFADINILPVAHFVKDRKWESYQGKLYFGPEYVILRREFQKDYPRPNNKIPNILITMGGSDAENLTEKILSAILPIPNVHITVILGKFFVFYDKIRQMITGKNNITICQDVPNVAEIMSKADLAITYFGVTAYELARMGVPAIIIAHSIKDKNNAVRFAEYGICISLGYSKEVNKQKIYSTARKLLSSEELREKISNKRSIDGRGAERIAKIIVNSEKRNIW